MSFIPNEPVEYMDLQTLWNDRRDPHASPLSSSPRRAYDRAPTAGKLHPLVDAVYEGVARRKDPDDPTQR